MDIAMTGRNVEVPARYRVHVTDKLAHLQRFNSQPIRYDVELDHENNPRQSKTCQRVEITGTGKGPTVRAEASGPDRPGHVRRQRVEAMSVFLRA